MKIGFSQTDDFSAFNPSSSLDVAIFIDSVFIGNFFAIDPNLVESMNITKEPTTINGKYYPTSIYISCKQTPVLLSLQEVKDKYIKEETHASIFLINGVVLTGDVSSWKIDDNYILKVNCIHSDEFENMGGQSFSIITIFTKTEENVKRSKEIRIR